LRSAEYEPPQAILAKTTALEAEIASGIKEIKKLLK
jgi:hypothetical protein